MSSCETTAGSAASPRGGINPSAETGGSGAAFALAASAVAPATNPKVSFRK
jgi:hypothetical protein